MDKHDLKRDNTMYYKQPPAWFVCTLKQAQTEFWNTGKSLQLKWINEDCGHNNSKAEECV